MSVMAAQDAAGMMLVMVMLSGEPVLATVKLNVFQAASEHTLAGVEGSKLTSTRGRGASVTVVVWLLVVASQSLLALCVALRVTGTLAGQDVLVSLMQLTLTVMGVFTVLVVTARGEGSREHIIHGVSVYGCWGVRQ
jgi:hypothetical protein